MPVPVDGFKLSASVEGTRLTRASVSFSRSLAPTVHVPKVSSHGLTVFPAMTLKASLWYTTALTITDNTVTGRVTSTVTVSLPGDMEPISSSIEFKGELEVRSYDDLTSFIDDIEANLPEQVSHRLPHNEA